MIRVTFTIIRTAANRSKG
ncbi:hypothetical protein D043_0782A, partial [Vibrio parahaemolyticus EKP-021]